VEDYPSRASSSSYSLSYPAYCARDEVVLLWAFPSAYRPSAPSTPSVTKDPQRATPTSHAYRRESTLPLVSWVSMYVQRCGKTNGEGKRCCGCR
jgi:hypothetical protein